MNLLKSFISLLALINPVGAIPFFLSLTTDMSSSEKAGTIRIASISVFCVIAVTALLGQQIIAFFGISVGSLEVGGGIIDWKHIFAQAKKAGIKHYFVEHDRPKQPIESITASYQYLERLRFS